ncbi:NnrS family protein [Roseateles sp. DAIF2]|uniref:NnrS family protein n=1 Tax=Roseateles sp. DAIF2 TaxID=2714952 RepID=UPI0018A2DA90|nr:NnrS family protein [Roseateles sp. DAIF2]QPF74003.1 NnrS family protein [Roseateles sp. DAIF2]
MSGRTTRPQPWRWARLLETPQRLCFAAAALLLAGSGLWWCLALLAAQQGWPLHWQLPPAMVHGLLMTLGPMPLFFAGFMFTAVPRWLDLPTPPARSLLEPLLAQLCGWAALLLAAHGGSPSLGRALGAIGLAAVAWGWSGMLWRFAALLRASEAADRTHARALLGAGSVGALCLWASSAALLVGEFALLRALNLVALWGFIGASFAAALHRMLPVFAAACPGWSERQPLWGLWAWLGLCAVEASTALWTWPPLALALALLEAAAGTGVLLLAWRWARVQTLGLRLIAMLWTGWCWLGLALLLSAASAWLPLGRAPLHAYALGFLGTSLLAMASRVSSTQAGRSVAADDATWGLFWVLQLVALARIGAALAPTLLLSAAIGWAGIALAFLLRHGRWWGLPRAGSGRPPLTSCSLPTPT